ncbi:MAG TPA: helix-turn-helix transcriptional regulator, partial [Rhodopila sp.]|nr:helix-turn-helix transcriptional regulator [Rhodopila sp.]
CPLSVTVLPLARTLPWQLSAMPVVLLLIVDPLGASRPDTHTLVRLFGLTAREAALVGLLADGNRLDDAATQVGIGRETARTHLARALAKTGGKRQADLVRLAMAAASPVALPPDG